MWRIIASLLVAGLLAVVGAGTAFGQAGNAGPASAGMTAWIGKENISGQWTQIAFILLPNQQALMSTGPGQEFKGTWQQQGSKVVMQFPTINTTFQGTVNGNTFSGKGQDNVGPWDFSVVKVKAAKPGQPAPAPQPAPAQDGDGQSSANGKYSQLLKVISVPQDQAQYGSFYDYGYYSGSSWGGYTNLPAGHWVYVYPNWYIWGQKN